MRAISRRLLALTIALSAIACGNVQSAKEQSLRQALAITREMIVQHQEDSGCYPKDLEQLVSRGYLRALPTDPMTGTNQDWVIEREPSEVLERECERGVMNIRSGSSASATDGSFYRDW